MADHADDDDEYALHDAIREGRDLDVIRSIVERDPQSLRRRSRVRGHLPLHAAIYVRSPPSVSRYLLQQRPDSVRELADNYAKDLPAHMACEEQCSTGTSDLETAQLFVEAWPEALHITNDHGYLPLHVANDVTVIRYLVGKWPESIKETNKYGMNLVHLAVERGAKVPVVRYFVETCPQLLRERDTDGRLPLHCISEQTRLDVVKYLVSQWQECLSELDGDGRVPLHSAVDTDEYDLKKIAEFLVDRAPQSARVRAKGGILPLHLAAKHEHFDWDCVTLELVVEAWPQAVRETTDEGLLPVHLAARHGRFPHVRFLVEQWPESVQEKTREGWLTVHLPLECNDCLRGEHHKQDMYETARFLMDRFPQSAMETTSEGYMPLHVAAMNGFCFQESDEEEVQMELDFFQDLIRRAPAAIRVASNAFIFPFHYAIKRSHLSVPAVRFLAAQWPDAVRFSDEAGQSAMHMALSQYNPKQNFVRFLSELRPQLLEVTDRTGSTPLHSAVAQPWLMSGTDPDWGLLDRDRLGELLEILRHLVEQRPQSLVEADHRGSLPLHLAAARVVSAALDVVRLLVEARPEALGAADSSGSLPLHVAVASSQPRLPLVEFLIEQRPEALGEADAQGSIPLHVAVARDTSSHPLVQYLVRQCPGSVRTRNGDGILPLFLAAISNAPLDVLFVLATAWPEAIYGSRRPSRPAPSGSPSKRRRQI